MKKALFLLLAASLMFAGTAIAGESITAHVSDSNCKAKHTDHSAESSTCVKTCIGNGADTVLVDAEGEVHVVANPEALKDHLGHQVTVMVTKQDDGKVKVSDVTHVAP